MYLQLTLFTIKREGFNFFFKKTDLHKDNIEMSKKNAIEKKKTNKQKGKPFEVDTE